MDHDEKIEIIEKKIKTLETHIIAIHTALDKLVKTSDKMDGHIDFITQVYSRLKQPLDYISGMFGYVESQPQHAPHPQLE